MKDHLLLLEAKARRYSRDRLLMESYIRNRREQEGTRNIMATMGDGNKLDELFYSL